MSERAVLSAKDLEFQGKFLEFLVGDFSPEDWWFAPTGPGGTSASPAYWIVGHLVASKARAAAFLGAPFDAPVWLERFGFGTTPQRRPGDPAPGELRARYDEVTASIVEVLRHLPASREAEKWPEPFPDGSQGLLEGVGFFRSHEQYHLGQIGYLRRLLGKTSFVDRVMEWKAKAAASE